MRSMKRHDLTRSSCSHSIPRSLDHLIPSPRGFTVVELLVVLAIIALIVGILLVAMGEVRSSARRTESANALRHMVTAYNSYSTDHNSRFMPGYVTTGQVATLDLNARRADGSLHTEEDSQGYVWRLAPFLGDEWETMFVDYGNKRLRAKLTEEYEAGVYGPGSLTEPTDQLGIARVPSFGLNTIFLGGDSVHGGPAVTDYSPWNALGNEPIAATRFSEVKNPAHMIVFAPAEQAHVASNPTYTFTELEFGYPSIRPPFVTLTTTGIWDDQQWQLKGDGRQVETSYAYAAGGGVPIARWGDAAFPVGNLDGSTTIETYQSLSNNMTRWSPQATGHFLD